MGTPEKRRRKRRRRSETPFSVRMGVLITVLVLIVAAAGILMVPALNVTEIYCEGCVNTNAADIISASGLQTGNNILLTHINKAKREIEKIPIAEEVNVRRVFPDKVCISIKERVPAAYVMKGAECVVIDGNSVVLEILDADAARTVVEKNTPKQPQKDETDKKDKDKQDKTENKEKESGETENKDDEDGGSEDKSQDTDGGAESETPVKYSVPLAVGFELAEAKEGKTAKSGDDGKLKTVLTLCKALKNAELMNRTTYIDVTDINGVKLVIENRLEVILGKIDNIEYRARFLAEVINTKMSPSEKAVMDYRGNDIYVRTPDDGGERMVKPQKTEEESVENTSEDEDDGETDEEE